MRIELGHDVRCSDGPHGELVDVVIEPRTTRITHLVVQPGPQHGPARLVPVAHAREGDGAGIRLDCTVEELCALATVREAAYLPVGQFPVVGAEWDVGVSDVIAPLPYDAGGLGAYDYSPDAGVAYDRVPKGEVELRHSSDVWSADEHHLGQVHAFLVDGDARITHVLLQRGHLWGRHEVTIPIEAVAEIATDRVTVSLSKDAVGALPSVPLHRHD